MWIMIRAVRLFGLNEGQKMFLISTLIKQTLTGCDA